jgi:hypothetical protein
MNNRARMRRQGVNETAFFSFVFFRPLEVAGNFLDHGGIVVR